MNVFDLFKFGKLAITDEKAVATLISQAKQMEGPKPSWKTGEFWFNIVVPTLAGIVGGAAAIFTAPTLVPYFVIAVLVLSCVGYLGRTALKMVHAVQSGQSSISDPEVLNQLQTVVQTVTSVVGAVKDAKAGNVDAAKTITDTLNAPTTTVNVGTK